MTHAIRYCGKTSWAKTDASWSASLNVGDAASRDVHKGNSFSRAYFPLTTSFTARHDRQ